MRAPAQDDGQWTEAHIETIIAAGIAEAMLCGFGRRDGEDDRTFFSRAYAVPHVAARMQAAGERALTTLAEES